FNTPQADAGRRIQAFRPGQATSVYPCVLNASDPLVSTLGGTNCSPSGAAKAVFPLGMVFPGDAGVPDGLTNNYLHAFAPRLGVAWSPNSSSNLARKFTGGPGNSRIRLGWGMFYDSNEELLLGENFTAQPPFGGSTSLNNTFLTLHFWGRTGRSHPIRFTVFWIRAPARRWISLCSARLPFTEIFRRPCGTNIRSITTRHFSDNLRAIPWCKSDTSARKGIACWRVWTRTTGIHKPASISTRFLACPADHSGQTVPIPFRRVGFRQG